MDFAMTRSALAIEFLLLFAVLPLAYRYSPVRVPALPMLWVVACYAGWQLLRDPGFDRARLWSAGRLPGQLAAILAMFVVAALAIWLGVRRYAPQLEWSLVRQHPRFWAAVMVAYPGLLLRALCGAVSGQIGDGRGQRRGVRVHAHCFSQLARRGSHFCGWTAIRRALCGDGIAGDFQL